MKKLIAASSLIIAAVSMMTGCQSPRGQTNSTASTNSVSPAIVVQPTNAIASTNSVSSAIPLGDDAVSASSNVPGEQYPKIDSEHHAAFRLRAPEADRVQVDIGGHQYDMTKDDRGLWSVVTPPLVVGFHYYSFIVDGESVADPASETFFGASKSMSGLEVPSPGEDFYDAKDVPHGEVREHWYYSQTNSAWRRCFVYTPPDYDSNPTARYPVVYLMPGAGEDERGWSIQGRVNFILDNLLAEGKAKPMILVMDNGGGSALFAGGGFGGGRGPAGLMGGTNMFPRPTGGTNQFGRGGFGRGGFGRGGFGMFGGGAGKFQDTLLHEIIPMIDSTYRTIPDREHRAMAGLSMGGMQTRSIGMAHLDTFSAIGIFSGGTLGELTDTNSPLANPAEFDRLVKVAFMSFGSVEGGSATLASYRDSLVQAGITNTAYYISPGTAHEWQSWRRSFYHFAPLLFQGQ
ncbi:MAG: alpha/beta hydrolase-fold protein [Limisphaerales bacterium]